MTFENAQAATATTIEAEPAIDWGLPTYTEEELAEMEKEDEAYFTPEKMAILNERTDRLDKICPYQAPVIPVVQ